MGGTKEGAMKAKQTRLAKNPNYFSIIGTKGGAAPHEGGTGYGRLEKGKDGLTGAERLAKLVKERKEAR